MVAAACGGKHVKPPPTVFEKVLAGPPLAPHTIAMNGETACAIAGDLRVECWGSGAVIAAITGGDGGVVPLPRAIPTLADAEELAMGAGHLCVERNGGEIVCFGGEGEAARRDIEGIPPARRVAVGGARACATGVDGSVWCWGWDGGAPQQLAGVDDARDVAVGDTRACIARVGGRAACWSLDEAAPVLAAVSDGREIRQIAARDNELCVASDARVRCIADGPIHGVDVGTLVEVDGGAVTAVAPAALGACVLGRGGGVQCQAAGGALAAVPGITDAVEIATSGKVACARRRDRSVACWGARERSGLLGEGAPAVSPAVDVALPPTVTIAALDDMVCAAGQGVRCWGDGVAKPTAPTGVTASLPPTAVLAQLAQGTCALGEDSYVRCWGAGRDAKIVTSNSIFVGLAAGPYNACALDTKGGVACWQLGDDKAEPVALPARATQVVVGDAAACALLGSGRVQCWGDKVAAIGLDKLGDIADATRLAMSRDRLCMLRRDHPPACVADGRIAAAPELAGAKQVAMSSGLTCIVETDGGVRCAGLGPDAAMRAVPLAGGKPTALAVGADFACVLRDDRTVACFGAWDAGQLGDDRVLVVTEPQPVAGLH